MIRISVNGEIREVSENLNVTELIDELGYMKKGFAVAINTIFVAIDTYESTVIKENDEIDILAPVQGG